MNQEIQQKRISERPELYEDVFNQAIGAAKAVASGAMEVQEATAIARDLTVASKTLDGDIKSRLVEHRLKMRSANAPQIEAPKAPAAADA